MPDGGSAPATVLRSEVVNWSVTEYTSRYVDCSDAPRFSAVFSNGKNAIMLDRQGVKRDTDIDS